MMTRAAMPAVSTEPNSESWLCRLAVIRSQAGRAAGGTLASVVSVKDDPA